MESETTQIWAYRGAEQSSVEKLHIGGTHGDTFEVTVTFESSGYLSMTASVLDSDAYL